MTDLQAPPAKPSRQPSAATRWQRKSRELRVLDALKSGASLKQIAKREEVSLRRTRDIVNALLAAHEDLEPPDGVAQLRSHRLDQAIGTSVLQMQRGSVAAVGQLVRALRELDRNAGIGSSKSAETVQKTEA